MSANETVHTSASGGQKAGNDERYDLIPTEPWRRLAIHAGTRIPAGVPSYHRMMQHAWAFWSGEEMDEACDWPHLIAAAWEAMRIVDPARPPEWVIDDRRLGERYDCIPAEAARQLALHFGVGAKKYDDDNWLRGYDWRLTFAAANRHAEQYRAGETHDPETGSHHLIAFAWHMLVLDEFSRLYPQYDTRTATKQAAWCAAEQAWREEQSQHDGCADGGIWCAPQGAMINDITVHGVDELLDEAARRLGPRTVDAITAEHKAHHWIDVDGDRWQWVEDERGDGYAMWHTDLNRFSTARLAGIGFYGPFTEAEPAPRIADELTGNHKSADWYDKDHDHWRWIDDAHGAGWSMFCSRALGAWDTSRSETVRSFGPFTEAI